MAHSEHARDLFAARVYVIGEVLISLVVLTGGFVLVFMHPEESVRLVGSGAISAVTVAWFSRRQASESANKITDLAHDELHQLREQSAAQQASIEALVELQGRRTNA